VTNPSAKRKYNDTFVLIVMQVGIKIMLNGKEYIFRISRAQSIAWNCS
jgi:hypothetical protein